MQICGNEETFDLENLYRCCKIARELTLKDEWRVGRVIARPYVGKKKGEFKRTSNRHDYALKPSGKTVLNALQEAGLDVISVGKIQDIFSGEGITRAYHSDSSVQGMEQTIQICQEDFHGLCFVNLVDFDALWGHRRNVEGYARELEKFDEKLGILMEKLGQEDVYKRQKHGSWLNMIESFFSKMTRQMLRGIRVNTKQELEERIYKYFDEVNREPVVYHWKYKMDEISEEEAASV